MLEVKNLTKRFGSFYAVDSLSFSVKKGEIYALLGPNGAGKTTTMLSILGLVKPSSGDILLFGEKIAYNDITLRRRIGVVPEKHPKNPWPWMTASDYLHFFAELYSVENASHIIEELLEKVELSRFRNRRIIEFSRGMLQKLSFIRALLPDPDILILDEPQSGLDPIGVVQIRNLILDKMNTERSVIISSHLLSEIEKIANRVAIISGGKLIIEGSAEDLSSALTPDIAYTIEVDKPPEAVAAAAEALPFVRSLSWEENTIHVTLDKERDYRKDLSEFLISRGFVPLKMMETSTTLEEVFVTITRDNLKQFSSRGEKQE